MHTSTFVIQYSLFDIRLLAYIAPMKTSSLLTVLLVVPFLSIAQLKWTKMDSVFGPLPASVHVYYTNDSLDGKPNVAYYVSAELNDKKLSFTTQVGNGKRYTPSQ